MLRTMQADTAELKWEEERPPGHGGCWSKGSEAALGRSWEGKWSDASGGLSLSLSFPHHLPGKSASQSTGSQWHLSWGECSSVLLEDTDWEALWLMIGIRHFSTPHPIVGGPLLTLSSAVQRPSSPHPWHHSAWASMQECSVFNMLCLLSPHSCLLRGYCVPLPSVAGPLSTSSSKDLLRKHSSQ